MQSGKTCLMAASLGGHMEVVRYLYDLGGKELLMVTDRVSVRMQHEWMRGCRHACVQGCSDAGMLSRARADRHV